MPTLTSVYFKELEYSSDTVYEFSGGLPGFEDQTAFVFIQQPHTQPLVYMQSLRDTSLCFLALPVSVIDANYQLALSADECAALGLGRTEKPQIGSQIACFVLLTLAENADPTVNLMSPIVLNLLSRKGIQAIPSASDYSLHHPLVLQKETASCS